MKKEILRTIMFFSKYSLQIFLIQLISMQFLTAAHVGGQSLKDVRIDLNVNGASPVEVFEIIEQKTDFEFGYNRVVAKSTVKLSFDYLDTSLDEILFHVAEEANLSSNGSMKILEYQLISVQIPKKAKVCLSWSWTVIFPAKFQMQIVVNL